MRTLALIPAFNEATTIAEVLESVRTQVDIVLVVDDGSSDRTGEIARGRGAIVVRHAINRGLGAAIGTGFEAAQRLGVDVVITLDADGQHDPEEIGKFIEAFEQGADMVIGSRLLQSQGMPWHRVLANKVGNLVTFLLFGAWVTDSQSGFRGFTCETLEKIEVKTNRMEVSSELIAESRRHRLNLIEVPIRAIYTEYSLSKGQSFVVGIKTLIKLVVRRMN